MIGLSRFLSARHGHRLTFARRIAIGSVAAALVPLIFALLIYRNFRANMRDTREVARAREALTLTTDLHRLVLEMEWSIRGFRLSGNEELLDPYRMAVLEYERGHAQLRRLLQGLPQDRRVTEMHAAFLDWHRIYAEPKIHWMRGSPPIHSSEGILVRGLSPALEAGAANRAMDEFRRMFRAFEGELRAMVSRTLEKRDRAASRLSRLLWVASSAASLVLLVGAAWLLRSYRIRSGALFAGLEAAQRGEYRAVLLSGEDEPARIAAAFNRTISEIERRDEELRHALEEHRRLLTERTEALEARRASEGKLQAILDNTTSVVYVKDVEGHYLLVNRRFGEIFHVDPKTIAGKTNFDVFPEEVARNFRAYDRETLVQSTTLEIEEVVPQDDGLHTYISVKFPLRDDHGGVYALAGISTDITERKRAEDQINRFFNLALEGLCIGGFDGYFKRVNPAWEQTLGFTTAELLACPSIEFVHPDDREATTAEVLRLYSGECEKLALINRIRCADGSYKVVLWNARADASRQLLYMAARDVTEERQRQEEVRQLNEQLSCRVAELGALNHELESFSYSVSHDLRAPLRHITGFAEMLDRSSGRSLDEKGSRYLRTISESAQRMGRLIDDLLTFSRMGRSHMSEGSVDLNALASRVQQDLQPETNGRQVHWKIAPLPRVRGDEAMLRQVLVNLMSNALKYTGSREQAEIEIGTSPNGDNEVVFFVRDNGVGFDMQYAHKLFGVFQRLHRAEEFEGTGVGLANVRRIVERHGGRAWAEAELERGATFYFSLPKEANQ